MFYGQFSPQDLPGGGADRSGAFLARTAWLWRDRHQLPARLASQRYARLRSHSSPPTPPTPGVLTNPGRVSFPFVQFHGIVKK